MINFTVGHTEEIKFLEPEACVRADSELLGTKDYSSN